MKVRSHELIDDHQTEQRIQSIEVDQRSITQNLEGDPNPSQLSLIEIDLANPLHQGRDPIREV
jgi:hypothetical protein